MTLQQLKESIEDRTFAPSSFVIVAKDKFLPLQYLEEISRNYKNPFHLNYIESLDEIGNDDDLFSADSPDSEEDIHVLNLQIVDFCSDVLYNNNNIIVIANEIDDEAKKFYRPILIEVPKLEEWQVKDMVYSFGKGADTRLLDWFADVCNNDINRLYQEMIKIRLFSESERGIVLNDMINDGAVDDLSSGTIFNLTGALAKKDISALKSVYAEIDNMDVNEFGLLTILYTNFSNMVQIKMGLNPTPDKLGLKPGQFNAIKYNCGKYNNGQLVKSLEFLSSIDKRIKTGELPTNILRDYIVLSLLSF
jgi:DNA polymerase III delta subunit